MAKKEEFIEVTVRDFFNVLFYRMWYTKKVFKCYRMV